MVSDNGEMDNNGEMGKIIDDERALDNLIDCYADCDWCCACGHKFVTEEGLCDNGDVVCIVCGEIVWCDEMRIEG